MYSGVPQKTAPSVGLSASIAHGTARAVRLVRLGHIQIAQTKVAERDVAGVVGKNVLRLEVAVDDVEHMQVLGRAKEFSGVEAGAALIELALALEMEKELAAVDKGHDEVDFVRVLERELERENEQIVDEREHGALGEGVISLGRLATFALRIVLSAYMRCVSFLRTCIPLPMTLSSLKASTISACDEAGLNASARWNAPSGDEYHWSEWWYTSSTGVGLTHAISRSLPMSSRPCTLHAVRR
jgi:hypothetical protein